MRALADFLFGERPCPLALPTRARGLVVFKIFRLFSRDGDVIRTDFSTDSVATVTSRWKLITETSRRIPQFPAGIS